MEAATQIKGCEFGADWDSTLRSTFGASGFAASFCSNSHELQERNNRNITASWRTEDESIFLAAGDRSDVDMSACFLTPLTGPPGGDRQQAVICLPEVTGNRGDHSVPDPVGRLSACSAIDSRYAFSSLLDSFAHPGRLQADNSIYNSSLGKIVEDIGIYASQPQELETYFGAVHPTCGLTPADSNAAALLPSASLEQSQGFVCNSGDIFPCVLQPSEDILWSSRIQEQSLISDMIHSRTMTSPSISEGVFSTGDAIGSHDNLCKFLNLPNADNQIIIKGQTAEILDRQNGIKGITAAAILPQANSPIFGDPSAKLAYSKDNSVGKLCSRQHLKRLMNVEAHAPYKGISTDAVGENPKPAKKSTPWNSINSRISLQDSCVMAYKSPIPPPNAVLNGSSPLNTNLRQRTKQGSASDPQSIAARHRRERISERLKILQDLVPNGSKVDLVTMLEKAINYVKFLQLQVKVLATDEYWPTRDKTSSSKIMKVEDALQALALAEAELGHACATHMDRNSATDQTSRI